MFLLDRNAKSCVLYMRYANPYYGKYPLNCIINHAYSIRSAFSHGDNTTFKKDVPTMYMKDIVLDVIKGYFNKKRRYKQ